MDNSDIPPLGSVDLGDLASPTPISTQFGFDRGTPVDRLYIERFLSRHANAIRGTVLEVGDDSYTRQFTADPEISPEVIHLHDHNATYTGDLLSAQIPAGHLDAAIITQTLHLIFEAQEALQKLHDALKPGGTLLLTVPGITQMSTDQWADMWYWSFTSRSISELATRVFGEGNFEVGVHGNVYAAVAFLEGLAVEELDTEMLMAPSSEYEVLVTLKATRSIAQPPPLQNPSGGQAARLADDPALRRALVVGWFSFSDGHATAGDLLAADVVNAWLDDLGIAHDTALAPPFDGGVDWRSVDPASYSHAIFVCGPFNCLGYEADFFARFDQCRIIGMDLTLTRPVDEWNPFDALLERDSPTTGRPDLVFASRAPAVPLVGVCRVEDYDGADVAEANAKIDRLLSSIACAPIDIDTRLDTDARQFRTPAAVERALAACDFVVTTRLHGTVLALKNGVPVIPIDPEPDGAKIVQQAKTLGWSPVFVASQVTDQQLLDAASFCQTAEARILAATAAENAAQILADVKAEFAAVMNGAINTDDNLRQASREPLRRIHERRSSSS